MKKQIQTGPQSLSHFQVTYIQLRSFVIQTSSAIYIDLAESCPFFFGDLHQFMESCHSGFISDLHLSWQNLITQLFFGDLYPFKESCHLGFVSDLHPSWRNLITQPFLVTYIHLRNLVTCCWKDSLTLCRFGPF